VTIEEFLQTIADFTVLEGKTQVDYLAFFLSEICKVKSFSAKDIEDNFGAVDVRPYSRIAPYLSEQAATRNGNYVKVSSGYRLARHRAEELRHKVGQEPKRIQVAAILKERLTQVSDSRERTFLKEALDCFHVQAFRATIILIWILTVDHLTRYIFEHHLSVFNIALAKNPDKKIKQILKQEDFAELSESKFIELMRAADIISNDIRKILDEKLGVRNSAAHPSDVEFDSYKATEFTSDLLSNAILRFKI
jgi:hypothetical protein